MSAGSSSANPSISKPQTRFAIVAGAAIFTFFIIFFWLPSCEGGRRAERAGGCFLVLHQFIVCSYQKTTTPVVFDAFPSFARLCWPWRASRRGFIESVYLDLFGRALLALYNLTPQWFRLLYQQLPLLSYLPNRMKGKLQRWLYPPSAVVF